MDLDSFLTKHGIDPRGRWVFLELQRTAQHEAAVRGIWHDGRQKHRIQRGQCTWSLGPPGWPAQWRAYTVTVAGVIVSMGAPATGAPIIWLPEGAPWGDRALEVRYQAATFADGKPGAEMEWRPSGALSAIRDADSADWQDVKRAWQGLKLLNRIAPPLGGRPRGTGQFASAQDLEQALTDAIGRLRSAGKRPTVDSAAEEIGVDPRYLGRLREQWGLGTWAEILARHR